MRISGLIGLIAFAAITAGCGDSGHGSHAPAPPDLAASELNPAPLPLGWMLPESRELCEVAPGVLLHRILRGTAEESALSLPCGEVLLTQLVGGGSPASLFDTGPYAFHILEIDPQRFSGHLAPALAQNRIAGKATASRMAAEVGALAAINAGFFVVGPGGTASAEPESGADGLAGDPAGITVIDGELLSEAVGTREALVFSRSHWDIRFPRTGTILELDLDGQVLALDGINRMPGAIRNCGGRGGDSPTEDARHDVTCTDPDEMVRFTPEWGTDTPAVDGLEAVFDAQSRLIETRSPGGPIPAGGATVVATGTRVDELLALAQPQALGVLQVSFTMDGEPASVSAEVSMLNGGPGLVRGGEAMLTDREGGFRHPGNPLFGLTWVDGRNPRTLIGRTATGRILLVVCDGRQPGWSAGLPLGDAVRVMQHLGAVDAMNLDGGGSSAMVVHGQVVNKPSDGIERPVSDALLVMTD